jgi:flagellar biosynthesis regulator FlaF
MMELRMLLIIIALCILKHVGFIRKSEPWYLELFLHL